MRLIDIDIFPLLPNKLDGDESEYERGYHDATDNLKALPLVDAVPVVRGEWKRTRDENGNALFAECSNCHRRIETVYQETKYCHSCGAKMEDKP